MDYGRQILNNRPFGSESGSIVKAGDRHLPPWHGVATKFASSLLGFVGVQEDRIFYA